MRHATLLELAERDGIALPDSLVSEWPPRAVGGRREGLVPLPAALRRRALGAAHRGRRTPAGARGRRGRRPRRRPVAGDPGRPERVRRPVRRDHRVHRPGARRRARRLARDRARHGRGDRRQPHPAPARRAHPGPAGRAVRRPRRGRLRAVQRRAARHHRRLRAGVRDRRAGRPAAGAARRRAARARPASGSASTSCTPTGSATACAPRRTRRCSTGSSQAGVALEVCPVSNVALGVYSDLTSVPLPTLLAAGATVALGADDPLLFGSRLAGAVRHDAGRPRPRPTPSWPSWPGCRCGPRGRRTEVRAGLLAEIDAWLALDPDRMGA